MPIAEHQWRQRARRLLDELLETAPTTREVDLVVEALQAHRAEVITEAARLVNRTGEQMRDSATGGAADERDRIWRINGGNLLRAMATTISQMDKET
jgi:hypothetical protein